MTDLWARARLQGGAVRAELVALREALGSWEEVARWLRVGTRTVGRVLHFSLLVGCGATPGVWSENSDDAGTVLDATYSADGTVYSDARKFACDAGPDTFTEYPLVPTDSGLPEDGGAVATLVFAGDSITALGWPQAYAQPFLGPGVKIVNLAIPGTWTEQWSTTYAAADGGFYDQLSGLGKHGIGVVILGTNDMRLGYSASAAWAALSTIGDEIHARGAVGVVADLPSWNSGGYDAGSNAVELNSLVDTNWSQHYDAVMRLSEGSGRIWTWDGIHPGPQGGAHLAWMLLGTVTPLIKAAEQAP